MASIAWRPLRVAQKNLRAIANKFIGPTFGWNLPKKGLFPENPRRALKFKPILFNRKGAKTQRRKGKNAERLYSKAKNIAHF